VDVAGRTPPGVASPWRSEQTTRRGRLRLDADGGGGRKRGAPPRAVSRGEWRMDIHPGSGAPPWASWPGRVGKAVAGAAEASKCVSLRTTPSRMCLRAREGITSCRWTLLREADVVTLHPTRLRPRFDQRSGSRHEDHRVSGQHARGGLVDELSTRRWHLGDWPAPDWTCSDEPRPPPRCSGSTMWC